MSAPGGLAYEWPVTISGWQSVCVGWGVPVDRPDSLVGYVGRKGCQNIPFTFTADEVRALHASLGRMLEVLS